MSRSGKWLAACLIILVIATVGRELLWRIDHVREGTPAAKVAGVVFETYLLPERSEVPYGVGVFARQSWNPLRSVNNSLVFAAYCGKELALRADGHEALEIVCAPQEGSPKLLFETFDGVKIRRRTG